MLSLLFVFSLLFVACYLLGYVTVNAIAGIVVVVVVVVAAAVVLIVLLLTLLL